MIQFLGRVDGEFNAENGRFNFGASIHAVRAGRRLRRGDRARVERRDRACVGISLFGGEINIGGGVQFAAVRVKLWPFDGCKWSRFDEPNVFGDKAARPRRARRCASTIERGDPSRAIRLDGAAGAPRVRVTTPGGEVLEAPDGPGLKASKGIRILRSERLKATVVGLEDPQPGTYTVETAPRAPCPSRRSPKPRTPRTRT